MCSPNSEKYVRRYRFTFQGQYSIPEDETGFLSFKLRDYDPKICLWRSVDPEQQYHSPYLAFGNNPLLNVDPDGGRDDIYTFDEDGNVASIEKQSMWHNFWHGHTGVMADGTEFCITNHIAKHLYEPPTNYYPILEEDPEANFGIRTTIETTESLENQLDYVMEQFSTFEKLPLIRLNTAYRESINHRSLDFSDYYKKEDEAPRLTIIETLSGYEAQNAHNIGNFLTGAAYQRLGVGLEVGRLGANLHAIFIQKHPLGDSRDDQRMIYEGYSWSRGRYINH